MKSVVTKPREYSRVVHGRSCPPTVCLTSALILCLWVHHSLGPDEVRGEPEYALFRAYVNAQVG